jgi:hypothetical protein
MSELHIIEKPITKAELKKIEDLKEREILGWIWINFQYFKKGELSKQDFKETILLGIEDIINR